MCYAASSAFPGCLLLHMPILHAPPIPDFLHQNGSGALRDVAWWRFLYRAVGGEKNPLCVLQSHPRLQRFVYRCRPHSIWEADVAFTIED